ncbi:unnamed protein product [Rotaria magnacalcarata]|nr:unnamed protein product [Rotaria magnacalcarata]
MRTKTSMNRGHIATANFRENSIHLTDLTECPICCNGIQMNEIKQMPCCETKICLSCFVTHTVTNIHSGTAKIECPTCSEHINSSTILYNSEIPVAVRERYQEILARDLSENSNNFIKLCPHCNFITILDEDHPIINQAKSRRASTEWICCEQCSKEWCWSCYAPSHSGITCRKYKNSHTVLDMWARIRRSDNQQRNAQRCPNCSIYIEKIDGCDHMACTKCNTKFCYRCGGTMRLPSSIGHDAKYSLFGCKYKLWPNRPLLRWLVRGSIFIGIILLMPIVLAVIIALIAVAIPIVFVFAVFGIPIYACVQCYKHA